MSEFIKAITVSNNQGSVQSKDYSGWDKDRSAEGGHYTVDVLEPTGGWIHIDDTLITHITEGDVLENGIKGGDLTNNSKSAYLLMYQRL